MVVVVGGARVAETRWLANHNSKNVALITPLRQQVAESVTAAPTVTHMSNCIGTSPSTARYEVRQAPTAAVALFRALSRRSSKNKIILLGHFVVILKMVLLV